MVDEVPDEAAHAVAADLRGRTVRVEVQHHEVGVGCRSGPHEDDPIGADAEVAIAQPCDGVRVQIDDDIAIVYHDEVVPQPVHLGERQLHMPSVGLGRAWPPSSPWPPSSRSKDSTSLSASSVTRADSDPVTSSHSTRASARNHVDWRFA